MPEQAQMTPEEADEVIQAALEEIRPAIQFDGGDLSYKDFDPETGLVRVALHGACVGCSMSSVTLQAGILRILQDRCPLVKDVENIGDTF